MRNKKWISAAAAVVLAVTALPFTVTARKNEEKELTKVTLNEVAHSIFYAPQYVAIEEGYFAEEGLDLTLVTGFGADKVLTALISGEADIGFMGAEASIYAYQEGATDPAVNFAQLTQRAGNFLVAREEMPDFKWEDLKGKKVLVTAGPTIEAIDPVRYISNHSSGKMGYAIAKMAMLRGADVTLVTGQTAIEPPMFVDVVPVTSAQDMYDAVTSRSDEQDIIIKAAAVADYTPANVSDHKVKKKDGDMSIELVRTKDILKTLGENKKEGQFLCGFSMETQNMLENSRAKLEKKKIDMIAANNLKEQGAGFNTDTNVITLITKDEEKQLPKMTKEEVADAILDFIISRN